LAVQGKRLAVQEQRAAASRRPGVAEASPVREPEAKVGQETPAVVLVQAALPEQGAP
jgi:acyl-coenzyme A synthetase/AMP-(fatty) acid ligase